MNSDPFPPTRTPPGPVRRRFALLGLAGLAALALATGCASKQTPVAPPKAWEEANRLSAQAARLQAGGDWPAALAWWERAGRQYRLLNDRTNLAVAWHNQAVAQRALGRSADALRTLELAARLNADLHQTQAWWRNQIVGLQVATDLARPDAKEALARLDARSAELADGPLAGTFLHERARLLMSRGELDEALRDCARALAVFERDGDRYGKSAAVVVRAKILRRLGRNGEAAESWAAALSEFEAQGDARGIAVALAGWGGCLAAEGKDSGKALDLLERAEANYRDLGLVSEARAVAEEARALGQEPAVRR